VIPAARPRALTGRDILGEVHVMGQQPATGARADPLVGQVLSQRYRILAKIGEGAMAAVYLAEHLGVGTNIVLKVLMPERAENQDLVERFLQEARFAAEIHHDNVIDIFYSGRSPEGQVFLAMEYLQGTTLFELLDRDGPMRWGRAHVILRQIVDALAAAHKKGVVHRDVKPENVVVMDKERPEGGMFEFVKVVDFGIANVEGGVGGTKMICGTPEYMAPEQARALPPDPRDDVYAFGCLMYQVLTGDVPFTAPSIQKVLLMHMQQPVQPPRERRPDLDIPPGAEEVVMRAMEKTRERRFQSMDELGAALDAVTLPRKGLAPAVPRLPGAGDLPGERLVFDVPEPKARRRRRHALAALVVVIFSTAALLVYKRKPPGRLEIVTVPADAWIYIDGRKMAERSPLMIDATAGRFNVVARREGCDDATRTVDLDWGQRVQVPLTLPVAETTRLDLRSEPVGARIWLDGEPLMAGARQARTPFSAGRIPPGTHTIEMDGVADHGSWRGEAVVILGSSRTLLGLLPRQGQGAEAPIPEEPQPRHSSHTSHSSHSSHSSHGHQRSTAHAGGAAAPTGGPPGPGGSAHGVTYIDLKSGTVKTK
jgi:serine/threonine-protein kinase